MLRNAPFLSTLLSVSIINGCCTLSNAFSAFIDSALYLVFIYLFFCQAFCLPLPGKKQKQKNETKEQEQKMSCMYLRTAPVSLGGSGEMTSYSSTLPASPKH